MTPTSITVSGVLKPDGTLELSQPIGGCRRDPSR
jgi:hypothetical protein